MGEIDDVSLTVIDSQSRIICILISRYRQSVIGPSVTQEAMSMRLPSENSKSTQQP